MEQVAGYRGLVSGTLLRRMLLPALLAVIGACASGDRPPQIESVVGAVYPPQAREQGIEGHVVVRYDLDVEGRVHNARVVSASPPEIFDESAVQAVSRWRFSPPRRDGEPQPVTGLESRLDFTLEGGEPYAEY